MHRCSRRSYTAASMLYNVMLAEVRSRSGAMAEYRDQLAQWTERVGGLPEGRWLARPGTAGGSGSSRDWLEARSGLGTQRFVEGWIGRVRAESSIVDDSRGATTHPRSRSPAEGQSGRLANPQALEAMEWRRRNGAAELPVGSHPAHHRRYPRRASGARRSLIPARARSSARVAPSPGWLRARLRHRHDVHAGSARLFHGALGLHPVRLGGPRRPPGDRSDSPAWKPFVGTPVGDPAVLPGGADQGPTARSTGEHVNGLSRRLWLRCRRLTPRASSILRVWVLRLTSS